MKLGELQARIEVDVSRAFAALAEVAEIASGSLVRFGYAVDRMGVPASRCRAMKKNGRACRLRRPCGIHGRRR